MSPLANLDFTPVPVRPRHDGWTPSDQRAFIFRLARGHLVDEAATELGHSRQSAYALRRRAGAESFAHAWDKAIALGRRFAAAQRCQPTHDLSYALETLLVPRFYRGRLVGFIQRRDNQAMLRALAEVDQLEHEWKLSKLTR